MKIWLTGSHWVWKTTLLNWLDLGGDFIKIPEIARINMAFFWKTPQEMTKAELHVFEPFTLLEQINYEITHDKFVSDRTVIDLLAYAEYLVDSNIYWKLYDNVKTYLMKKRYDFIFYIPIEFPLVLDWVRFSEDSFQQEIDAKIVSLLQTFGIPYIKVTGDEKARIEMINKIIKHGI